MPPANTAAAPSPDAAGAVLAACGIATRELRYLTTGATSQAWDVRSNKGQRYVLRIAEPNPGKQPSYEVDVALRQRLIERGGVAPPPVATDRDIKSDIDAAWCLDEYVEGAPGVRGELPPRACFELGELLAILHSLQVEGHGLLEDRRDRLKGMCDDRFAGFASRLEIAWPFTGTAIEEHPIAAAAPELAPAIAAHKPEILALVEDGATGVVHTDLHEGQILLHNGRLAALLDFGDAVAGPLVWDIASFGCFHGWKLTDHLLEGYTDSRTDRRALKEQAQVFSIVIALHRAARAAVLNRQYRMDAAVRFLRDELPHRT